MLIEHGCIKHRRRVEVACTKCAAPGRERAVVEWNADGALLDDWRELVCLRRASSWWMSGACQDVAQIIECRVA